MSWNHRIMAKETEWGVILDMHEVHYNDEGTPKSYTTDGVKPGNFEDNVDDDGLDSIKWTLLKMLEATSKPILWYGDKFPQEYIKEEYGKQE